MKKIILISLFLSFFILSGCSKQSDEYSNYRSNNFTNKDYEAEAALRKVVSAIVEEKKEEEGLVKLSQQIKQGEKTEEDEYGYESNQNNVKNCLIKGNINYNTGEKIYHLPECEYYDATIIDERYGERWFCAEREAINAGWRKAYTCP